jgi:heat shock protein HslJ
MKKFLALLSAALLLSACEKENTLLGQTFTLSTNPEITLVFDATEPHFYGQALNNYFGTYTLKENTISLELKGSTMTAGSPEEMAAEQTYFATLQQVKTFSLDQGKLILNTENKTLIFENKH